MYYWFWGTEAMAEVGGKPFRNWSRHALASVAGSQRRDGAFRGSWDPVGPWGREGGRVYATALMAMVLARPAK
ncbi:MAG: hypothetical protein GF328_00310 [Candidatus Latescibacteria bacterium]|nr:hypothetical protein [Candidatus Latescibacterota bacterium]